MAVTIGIRELRQHASRYLARVKAGEVVTITERGEPIAEMRPIPRRESALERLEREGRLSPATRDLRRFVREHPPLPYVAGEPTLSEILRELRDDEPR